MDSDMAVVCPDQVFLRRQTQLICNSYRQWTGRTLIDGDPASDEAAKRLFEAGFAVLSHDTRPDPVFNYANRFAMRLFGMSWQEITQSPSRHSAEAMLQEDRDRLLKRVSADGYVDDYSGVRIAKDGSRFMIRNATVWNLIDENGVFHGQAALITEWQSLR
ncbi:hypothetical protein MTYP_00758 [Methylophilaceae bacterium]|nr:hypothetical protein MTYP_00758 [Methylophilaceae bacterium]